MQQCGFCSMLSGLLRRAMCVGSRRGSSDSYYRELGDQDTLKLEDRSSDDLSDASTEINGGAATSPQDTLGDELSAIIHRNLCNSRFLTMHKRRRKRLVTRALLQEAALLDDLLIGQVQCILNQSVQWRFNAFTLENVSGGRCLPVLCVHLFHMYGLLTHFKLDAVKAWKLFSLIEEGYHSTNPYHNSIHAADVTQAMHCFLQQRKIREHLEPLEIMASLLAAIAHDLDHPGVNQPFLIATSNHLATLYKNTSVLENHHWRSAVSCIIESGILDQMRDIQTKLQSQISSLILATDITRQQEYLSQFKGHLDTDTLDMTKKEHRHLVLQIALKCADISNPCRPWEISRKWSMKVCEEFFRQGDYERKLKIPVTSLCDRYSTSIPQIQTGFFKFVVNPLITEWHRFLHNDLSKQMLKNLRFNQDKWEALVAQELAEEAGLETTDAVDLMEDDLEAYSLTNASDSSDLLLPLRRSSLNPVKPNGLKAQLRRFSAPLNVFQDKSKSKEKRASSAAEHSSPNGSEPSVHSASVRALVEPAPEPAEKVLSTENLLPDSTIASITTPVQATRIHSMLKEGSSWRLVRQQTFPPLEGASRSNGFFSRPLQKSNEEPSRYRSETWLKFDAKKDGKFYSLFKKNDTTPMIETGDGSSPVEAEEGTEGGDAPKKLEKENLKPVVSVASPTSAPSVASAARRESVPVGSQLRDNITSVPLSSLASDNMLRRRKSMPADAIINTTTPRERKVLEMTAVLPQLLRRTLSGKEACTRRRGSAPAPVAPSELRGLTTAVTHSANGARKKLNQVLTCPQWITKATYSLQEHTMHLPRRSSLPVEVLTGI